MSPTTFEGKLTASLDNAAESLPVETPVFDPEDASPGSRRRVSGGSGRVVLVGACAAVVAGLLFVGSAIGVLPSANTTSSLGEGVEKVTSTEVVVWMNPDAQEHQIAGVLLYLDRADHVTRYTFIGKDQAYEQFQEFFADEPELLGMVEADQLPTSFVVETSDDPEILVDDLLPLPGVADIEWPGNPIAEPNEDPVDELLHNLSRLNPLSDE